MVRGLEPPNVAGATPASALLRPRELEVLRLAGDGLSDAQIAASLFLSSVRWATSLGSAYRKLGVHSRTAALRRAAELVGPDGQVVAVDHNPQILKIAYARCQAAGRDNVVLAAADLNSNGRADQVGGGVSTRSSAGSC